MPINEFQSKSEKNGLSLLRKTDRKILSVGISTAGLGEIKMFLKNPERKIIATTIDQGGVKKAKENVKKAGLAGKIEVKLEDVSKPMPYTDDYFNFVYARLVLHYLPKQDLDNALKEIYRVLKPGGHVFIVVKSTDNTDIKIKNYDKNSRITTYKELAGGKPVGKTKMRYFHSKETITKHLIDAGFKVMHLKKYKERLCPGFNREELSKHVSHLIEIFIEKS